MKSLKANIILNFLNTATGIIFPVITFPYAARILLPEGIGAFNFLQSIINYIVLLTSLGIPMYAVREIAKCRDNIQSRNRTTIEITLLSFILCLGGYVLVYLLGNFVPEINANLSLFYVLSLTVLFTALGVNWFYQAIEEFKFITIRALAFRILAAAGLFMFVKSKDDLLIYAFVVIGSTVGNNIINFIHLRKYIRLCDFVWSELRIWRHLKPSLHIFVFNLIVSIYVNLNTVMLGFMQDDEAVGYYTAGNKLAHVVLSVISSLGVVMLPRCSNLVEAGEMKQFASITQKAYRLVMISSLPAAAGLIALSAAIIQLFCGSEFLPATTVLCWTAPVIIFIGLSNVLGIQILYPQGKENIVIASTLGGAVINVILNLIFIPTYSYVGAAISTFFAEITVLLIQIIKGRKYVQFPLMESSLFHYCLATLIMSIIVYVVDYCIDDVWIGLICSIISGVLSYVGTLWMVKDSFLIKLMGMKSKRFRLE